MKAENELDLNRDVLKSETCNVLIPELSLEHEGLAISGKFTTVEGLLLDIKKAVSNAYALLFIQQTLRYRLSYLLYGAPKVKAHYYGDKGEAGDRTLSLHAGWQSSLVVVGLLDYDKFEMDVTFLYLTQRVHTCVIAFAVRGRYAPFSRRAFEGKGMVIILHDTTTYPIVIDPDSKINKIVNLKPSKL